MRQKYVNCCSGKFFIWPQFFQPSKMFPGTAGSKKKGQEEGGGGRCREKGGGKVRRREEKWGEDLRREEVASTCTPSPRSSDRTRRRRGWPWRWGCAQYTTNCNCYCNLKKQWKSKVKVKVLKGFLFARSIYEVWVSLNILKTKSKLIRNFSVTEIIVCHRKKFLSQTHDLSQKQFSGTETNVSLAEDNTLFV